MATESGHTDASRYPDALGDRLEEFAEQWRTPNY